MNVKSKIGVCACALALASAAAIPAYAVDYSSYDSATVGGGSTEAKSDLTINAELVPSDKFVKVVVPTKVAVAYKIDKTNDLFLGDPETNFFGPTTAKIHNDATSAGAVKVTLSTTMDKKGSDGSSFLDTAKLTVGGVALASTTADVTLTDTAGLAKGQDLGLPVSTTADNTTSFAKFVDATTHAADLSVQTQFKVSLVTP